MSILRSWDGLLWYSHPRGIIQRELNALKTMMLIANSDSIFVDVGAHIGFYTVRMAKICRHVHAIEPDPESIEILKRNLELNGINNVTIHPVACGDVEEERTLYTASESSTLYERPDRRQVKVQVKRLDNLVPHCNIVKIDVEGWEEKVLLGARRLIEESKPIWIVEHHEVSFYPEATGSTERIREIMKDYKRITIDTNRCIYIHSTMINQTPKEFLKRILTLHYTWRVLQNLEKGNPWYYGMPYTWWWGYSAIDFIEQLPDHILNEPEWMEKAE